MLEEIGIIERINKDSQSATKLFGIMLWGARDDTLCITKFYEPTWRNLFKYKQLGTFNVATPTIFKERDVVKVAIRNNLIISIEKTGVLSRRDMLIHDLRGMGAIAISIVLVVLLLVL